MRRIIHREIIQGTDEWHDIKLGRITSTKIVDLDTKGRNEWGIGAKMFGNIYKAVAEVKTQQKDTGYTNKYMENGMELESVAIAEYEARYFTKVEPIGFVSYGDHIGDSPDGYVGDDGCIEVKCPTNGIHQKRLIQVKKDGWKTDYFTQMEWHMAIGGRKWCDYIDFNNNFAYEEQMIVKRFVLDDDRREYILNKADKIESCIKSMI